VQSNSFKKLPSTNSCQEPIKTSFSRSHSSLSRLAQKTTVPKLCSVDDYVQLEFGDSLPFSEVIDVRTATEFAEDHLPQAVNIPVLDEDERARVGKLHGKNKFEGHKVGASLISKNVARIIEERLHDKGPEYSPLIYCWRGGLRSHSLALVLANVGFDVAVLEGGHKAYRHRVRDDLESLPSSFRFRVISGPTGSGKSALLRQLKAKGAQVVDLEFLAKHKGSVLGRYPDCGQPKQKLFESLLWAEMQKLDPSRDVWVESESKRIGNVFIPELLFKAMGMSPRVELIVSLEERIRHTLAEYDYFIRDPDNLISALSPLKTKIISGDQFDRWLELIQKQEWSSFVRTLLVDHYDPTYARSQSKNSEACESRTTLRVESLEDNHLTALVESELVET